MYPNAHPGYPSYPPHTYPAPYPPPPPEKRTAAAVIGIVLALVASGALVLAFLNLSTAADVVHPDGLLPYWVRSELFDAALARALIFGGTASVFALVGVLLGIVARRGAAGKIAITVSSLVLTASAFAHASSLMQARVERDPDAPKEASVDPLNRHGAQPDASQRSISNRSMAQSTARSSSSASNSKCCDCFTPTVRWPRAWSVPSNASLDEAACRAPSMASWG